MRSDRRKNSPWLTRALLLMSAVCLAACRNTTELAEPATIGIIVATEGSPSVVRNNRSYILDLKSRIYEGDIVRTDNNSRVFIEMIDETKIDLGTGSHVLFHEYAYQARDASPVARMTMSSGSIRASTNFLASARRGRFEIGTPVATISVYGADLWGGLVFEKNTLDIALLAGRGFSVSNDHGSVEVETVGEGTTVIGGAAPQPPKRWSQRKLNLANAETDR